MSTRFELNIDVEPTAPAGPVATFIVGTLGRSLKGFNVVLTRERRRCSEICAQGSAIELGDNLYLGDFLLDNSVQGFGFHGLFQGLRVEYALAIGLPPAALLAPVGLAPGMEDTLIRFGGWDAVPADTVAKLSVDEQRLAAASARNCKATPSGLRWPTPSLLARLRARVAATVAQASLPSRANPHYVRHLPLDLSRLNPVHNVILKEVRP